jgi:hypothetical protein
MKIADMLLSTMLILSPASADATDQVRADHDQIRSQHDVSQMPSQEDERMVRVTIRDARDLGTLAALGANLLSCEPRPGDTPAIVPQDTIPALEAAGLRPVMIDPAPNQTASLVRERALRTLARGDATDWWADYKPLDAIYAKMYEMESRAPDLVEVFEFGRSFEDRPMLAMRIVSPSGPDDACRPAVLFNTLIHAREWVPPMANMFVAETLINGYGNDPYLTDLVDRVEWLFVPVLNPDGYEYTWTTRRFWRKNRNTDNPNRRLGVDLNRNYGVGWGSNVGSSGSPISDTYRGTAPFSERETSAIRDLVLDTPQLRVHNDMHSYSELILYPWGFQPDLSPDESLFNAMASEMRRRIIEADGPAFRIGPVFTAIYPVSGGSVDWFYGERGVLSFSYELGTRFDEPPSAIRRISEETLSASLHHGEVAADEFRFRADLNRDCRHDFFDVSMFLNAYVNGSAAADIDASGSIEPSDLTAFLDLFTTKR